MDHSEFESKVLGITTYGGNKNPGVRNISASQLDNDSCQDYMKFLHGSLDDMKIGANTFGSLMHIGLEGLEDKENNIYCEKPMQKQFNDDWTISGTIDYIDFNNKIIRDFKFTKLYAYTNFDQNGGYAWQLNLQNYLAGGDFKMFVSMFIRDYEGNFKQPRTEAVKHVAVSFKSGVEIEHKIQTKIDKIESIIANPDSLVACENLWWGKEKVNGQTVSVPRKCKYYCSYGAHGVCPFYNPNPYKSKADIASSW